jgi:hypothetical protein
MCFSVDEKLRVRVTDNALSRDLFPTDYYCLGDNENRPIKWLAIESLQHKQFTGASDVVSTERRWRKVSAYFPSQNWRLYNPSLLITERTPPEGRPEVE